MGIIMGNIVMKTHETTTTSLSSRKSKNGQSRNRVDSDILNPSSALSVEVGLYGSVRSERYRISARSVIAFYRGKEPEEREGRPEGEVISLSPSFPIKIGITRHEQIKGRTISLSITNYSQIIHGLCQDSGKPS